MADAPKLQPTKEMAMSELSVINVDELEQFIIALMEEGEREGVDVISGTYEGLFVEAVVADKLPYASHRRTDPRQLAELLVAGLTKDEAMER